MSLASDHILVLDDDIMMLEMMSRLLSNSYVVHTVSETDSCWDIIQNHPVKVLIIDFHLQEDVTGVEFAQLIRQMYPLKQIVLITGDKSKDTVIEALNSKAIDGFLSKPFERNYLFELIKEKIGDFDLKDEVVHKTTTSIQQGRGLPVDQLGIFGSELSVISGLFLQGVDMVIKPKKNTVIAVLFYREGQILYQNFIDEAFKIRNEELFFGFIEGLSSLSAELFSTVAAGVSEIELQEKIKVLVSMRGEYRGIVFLAEPVWEKGSLINEMEQLFDQMTENQKLSANKVLPSVHLNRQHETAVEEFLTRI